MRKYRLIAKKGEGTFSEVIKAQNIKKESFHAIKCMKSSYKSADQVNSLREIQAIKRLAPHQNIVKLEEVLFDPPSGRLALVFELLEGNLYELMKDRSQHFGEATVKSFMRQIFTSLDHMHGKGVFHRDIKPENILVDKHGKNLKLADFGSCRGINSKPPFTEYISTRWYRPPECLLTRGMYSAEMDIWGAGCILFELTTLYPLFPGSDEADQIYRIHRVLGTPKASVVAKLRKHVSPQATLSFPRQDGIGLSKMLPDANENYLDLLKQSVAYDTSERITSKCAMKHPYFVGDHSFPSSTFKGAKNPIKGSRRAKVAPHDIPSSSSFPSGPTNMAKASGPVQTETKQQIAKPRSMVSILLARNNKKEFIQESKARNNTFHRKGGKNNSVSLDKDKTSNRTKLPKLKSLAPDNKGGITDNPSFKKHTRRQPKKYAHIRSTGYGGVPSSTAATRRGGPPVSSISSTNKLPTLNHSHQNHSHRTKLNPLRRSRF
eukprot:CAMPEP_0181134926 /NCGR_PEP_ID=MMETSP1071-20121207/32348_1 /TAXON_ID=35127 /ORGANISM="Thalassiosira sp., Strain NH16" /LENGTH=490 /DNA_ID=CAMNT_0023221477 /DNA_START=97 /DNA_END=1570 /DNA_ORIENTATION=+